MRIRDSGMPDERTWEAFFDAAGVLQRLGFSRCSHDIVDFGCGYGTFSMAAAALTTGTVQALDIDAQRVAETGARAQREGFTNVRPTLRDFVGMGAGLPDEVADYAMLFNILHAEDAAGLVSEAFRVLRPGGVLGIIHWIYDAGTPRGPPMAIRPRPEQCTAWARQAGFRVSRVVALPPYHYGLRCRKS